MPALSKQKSEPKRKEEDGEAFTDLQKSENRTKNPLDYVGLRSGPRSADEQEPVQ